MHMIPKYDHQMRFDHLSMSYFDMYMTYLGGMVIERWLCLGVGIGQDN